MRRRPVVALAPALLLALGCGDPERKLDPGLEWRNDMARQNKVKAQSTSELFEDGKGDRDPVPGTVPRGERPYPYVGQPQLAALELTNPLPYAAEIVARGENRFNTFCVPCHGPLGMGDGKVPDHGFPAPPTLHSAKVKDWPDGAIFHVISAGQNAMPSYARQIPERDRWAILHYLRALQRARDARLSDMT